MNGYPICALPPNFLVTGTDGIESLQYVQLDAEAGLILNLPPNTTAEALETALGAELTSATGRLKTGDTVTYEGEEYRVIVMGDVDKTGTVNTADAAVILRATVKLETLDTLQLAAANLGFAASYTAADAVILHATVKLETLDALRLAAANLGFAASYTADAAVILRATVKLETLDALQLAAANLGFAASYTAAAKILRYSVKPESTLGKVS